MTELLKFPAGYRQELCAAPAPCSSAPLCCRWTPSPSTPCAARTPAGRRSCGPPAARLPPLCICATAISSLWRCLLSGELPSVSSWTFWLHRCGTCVSYSRAQEKIKLINMIMGMSKKWFHCWNYSSCSLSILHSQLFPWQHTVIHPIHSNGFLVSSSFAMQINTEGYLQSLVWLSLRVPILRYYFCFNLFFLVWIMHLDTY